MRLFGEDGAPSARTRRAGWLLGFTAVFAVLIGFVFWGTWSLGFAPVMPDNAITHSPYWATGWWRAWVSSGKFVPGDLLVFLGGPYFWQELKYAFALYCAALGMAYYCRGRGLSPLAAYGSGLLLALSGYWCTLFSAGHYGWFQWMTYGVFAFALCDRAVRRGKLRHWLLLGACAAWGSFYQTDLWLLFSVFTGLYFVWCCVRERKFPWKGTLLALGVFVLIGLPSFRSAFVNDLAGRDKQIAEGQTVGGDAKDEAEKRWIFATNWSLPPDETAEFFVPRLNGDTSCPMTLSIGNQRRKGVRPYTGALGRPKDAPQGNYRQHSLYVGWVTCLLALLGLVTSCVPAGRKAETSSRRDIGFLAVAMLVFWLFSLGRYCEPVYRLVYALPFGDYLRAPVKWHHLTEFCIVALAAYGIDWLSRLGSVSAERSRKWLVVVAAVVLFGACDLARVAHLYCAPVDVRAARRLDGNMQMTFMGRNDFANPQVAAMVKAGRIVSLAAVNQDMYLVGVVQPFGKPSSTPPEPSVATWLGLLSALTTLAVAGVAVRRA